LIHSRLVVPGFQGLILSFDCFHFDPKERDKDSSRLGLLKK